MNPRLAFRKQIVSICAPALGIAIAYSFVFYGPLQRSLKAELSKLHKLESAATRRTNIESLAEKLDQSEAEVRLLNDQIDESKQVGSHLVARRANLRDEYLQSSSPATTMAETLALLHRHGLVCINSTPTTVQDSSAWLAESLKPVAVLLGEAASQKPGSRNRREMRITLRGRFQDVQSALREIQAAPLGVFTVSLEMEDSDAHSDVRIWILTIAV